MISMKKLRFSSHLREKVRCQGPEHSPDKYPKLVSHPPPPPLPRPPKNKIKQVPHKTTTKERRMVTKMITDKYTG